MKAISMCWMSLRFFVFLLFAFTANAAGSQSVATYRAETRLVEVATTVLDHHGHFVDGLDAKDFEILDNGVPQKIKYFANNTESLSCAILLDTTGSMDKVLPRLKNSVVTLVEAFGPKDRFAIYSFDEQLHTDQEFTGDKAAAKRAVLRLRAAGATALFDALAEATLETAQQPGKKALILFTDGDDNASVLNANAAVNRAKKNGIPLFTIAEGDALESKTLKKLLLELSKSTGGESYEVKSVNDIDDIFKRIDSELQHMYLLSYQPPADSSDGKWRKIDVAVGSVKDARIRAKEGYFPR